MRSSRPSVPAVVLAFLLSMFVTACTGQNPLSPTSAVPTTSATRSVADQTPIGNPANACNHDAPTGFYFRGGLQVNDRYKNDYGWRPVAGISAYTVEYTKRGESKARSFTHTGKTESATYDIGEGVWVVRVRGECGDGQGVWTGYIMFTNGRGEFGPDVPPAPEPEPEPTPEPHPCEVPSVYTHECQPED